ncbi:MAG: YegS/Rv2252/BmrU family lipid kinase [Lachnospiraceae bacterium]|nr:YegS/Rv2252/BmrU family lipid kinase [Lachnospiraceae bacterium]
MKKLKLVYNPFSGDKSFKFDLDVCIKIFQQGGYDVHVFRSIEKGDIERHFSEMPKDYDVIVASGGDGTVNLVLNSMMKYELNHIPLGIIPSGTANDFASFLNFKTENLESSCSIIVQKKPKNIDIGYVNGKYFINVCAGGILSNVSQNVDTDFKNALGKMAYYIKGLEQLPDIKPLPLKITTSKGSFEEDIFLFLILNSAGAGSFTNLAPYASISDGKLDFIAVKAKPVFDIAKMLVNVLRGEHIHYESIIYLQDSFFNIEFLGENNKFAETNIDGEAGPLFPIEVKALNKAIKVFENFNNKY